MQGWFHGHGIYYTIDGMKFEGKSLVSDIPQTPNSLRFILLNQTIKQAMITLQGMAGHMFSNV